MKENSIVTKKEESVNHNKMALQEIAQLDEAIKEYSEVVKLEDSIKNLEKSDDWKAIIKAYIETEPERLSSVLSGTAPISIEVQQQLQEKLIAIRHFRLFISTILTESFHASESISTLKDRKKVVKATIKVKV